MNVYGYTPYPYNQTDEKMFAQQAFEPALPYANRTPNGVPEAHAMPAPTGTPWNVQGVSWGMSSPPELVQFTAPTRQSLHEREPFSPVIHCKRKSLDVEPIIPAKQRLTEEKMAAHLNSLHISTDYTSHSLVPEDTMDVYMEPSTSSLENLKGHRIVLSEEIKKLQDEPLLPAALIESLEKPGMSLVVWRPREHIIGAPGPIDKKEKEVESPRRNGVLVPSLPTVEDIDM